MIDRWSARPTLSLWDEPLTAIPGIFVSLGEFGPGVATILVANESYPTPIRGTLVGLSAAVGKAGAAIGTQGGHISSGCAL